MSDKTIGAKVTEDQYAVFEALCTERGILPSEGLREALEAYVIANGRDWPDYEFGPRGGDKRSKAYQQSRG